MPLKQRIFSFLFVCAIFLFCLSISLTFKIQAVATAFLTVLWCVSGNFKGKFCRIKQERWRKILLLPCFFYVLHLIGLIYTSDFDYAVLDLEIKLSLFLIPLILATLPNELFTPSKIALYLGGFLLGTLGFSLDCLYSSLTAIFAQEVSYQVGLSYSQLSRSAHVAYLSLSCSFSVLILYHLMFFKPFSRWQILLALFIVYFSVFVLFLDSRAGTLSLSLVLVYCFFDLILRRKHFLKGLIFVLVFVLVAILLHTFLPGLGARTIRTVSYTVEKLKFSATKGESTPIVESQPIRTLKIRDEQKTHTKNIIRENILFGVGTGDFKQAMLDESHSTEDYLNAHHQFLQTWATLGIGGLSLLLILFFFPIFEGIRINRLFVSVVFCIFALNCLFESMIERQHGVFLLCFCFFLLVGVAKEKEWTSNKS